MNDAVAVLPFTRLSHCPQTPDFLLPSPVNHPTEAAFCHSQDSSADRFLSSLGRFMTGLDTKNNVKVKPFVPIAFLVLAAPWCLRDLSYPTRD